MNRVDIEQSLGRIDRRAGLVLRGQHGVSHRSCMSRQTLTLKLQPMIEGGIKPCEVIEERPPKELQAFRLRSRCRRQNTGIDLESVIQQQKMITIRPQQRSDARPKGDPQFMHRLPERRPSLLVLAPAP